MLFDTLTSAENKYLCPATAFGKVPCELLSKFRIITINVDDVGTELTKSDVNMLITARNKILKMTSKTFERKCEKLDFITKLLWK